MDNWYNQGYFHNNLRVKLKFMSTFMKLKEMLYQRCYKKLARKKSKSIKAHKKYGKGLKLKVEEEEEPFIQNKHVIYSKYGLCKYIGCEEFHCR